MKYDVIGDIHGHAEPLTRLLAELGYSEIDGAYRHGDPYRMAVFLGDIIDRGPEQLRSIEIVRAMQAAKTAICLMGNHEHAAIGWMLEDPENPGAFLRPHDAKNYRQHRVFFEQVGDDPEVRADLLEWMLDLPLYVELEGIRLVHACWQPDVIEGLKAATAGTGLLRGQPLVDSFRKGHPGRELVDIAIRGREADLPEGITFIDGDGTERDKSRVRWWSHFIPDKLRDMIVDEIDTDADADPSEFFINVADTDPRPVFFGHYWMKGEPSLMSPKAACLDFSVAAAGSLAAYTWQGETELVPEHLTWVDSLQLDHPAKFG
jgi:hypothetical protein